MDDATKENEPEVDERTRKKRASAECSRQAKREALGEEEFLRQKREAARELRKRQKAAAAAAEAATAAAAQHAAAAAPPAPPPPTFDLAGQLAKLAELWAQGALSDAEFGAAKAMVLTAPPAASAMPSAATPSPPPPQQPPVVSQPPPPPPQPRQPQPQPPTAAEPQVEVSWQQLQAAAAEAAIDVQAAAYLDAAAAAAALLPAAAPTPAPAPPPTAAEPPEESPALPASHQADRCPVCLEGISTWQCARLQKAASADFVRAAPPRAHSERSAAVSLQPGTHAHSPSRAARTGLHAQADGPLRRLLDGRDAQRRARAEDGGVQ